MAMPTKRNCNDSTPPWAKKFAELELSWTKKKRIIYMMNRMIWWIIFGITGMDPAVRMRRMKLVLMIHGQGIHQ